MDNRSVGTSLLSVMICLSLGMIVLFNAMIGYQVVKKYYLQHKATQQVLHTARTAFQFLARDLEASGYRGVRTREPHFKLHTHMRVRMDNTHLYAVDRRLVFGFSMYAHPMYAEGRDVLMIYDVPRKRYRLGMDQVNANEAIHILGKNDIRKGALILISDYLQSDLFIANDVIHDSIFHNSSGVENVTSAFSKSYKTKDNTEIVELQTIVYYLKKFSAHSATYGLYRENVLLSGSAQELLQDIIGFQLKYGIWNPETKRVDYYSAEHHRENQSNVFWPNVISVQITLTILNQYTQKEESFETEIALRNTPLTF